jgi:HD-GYP domain-containing protein (c-di-GMP phosphodiesterase class II)/DNA-binding CsgD family transcriptional regulator
VRTPGIAAERQLRLAELLASLALATDLANGFALEKSLRNCLLAVLLGAELGLEGEALSDVYYTSLLRSIGCTSFAYEEALATGDDRNIRNTFAGLDSRSPSDLLGRAVTGLGAGRGPLGRARAVAGFLTNAPNLVPGMAGANCEAGARLAERLRMTPAVQSALTQIHERWDGRGIPSHLSEDEVATAARLTTFAHDVTVHLERSNPQEVRRMARRRSGGEHDPSVVDAFLTNFDAMVDAVSAESVWDAVIEAEPEPRPWLPETRLDDVARAFADFVDLKSPYTLTHSAGVAALARHEGEVAGLPETDVVALHRAALLHDLGRVSVSNGTWDKRGPLSPAEWERVRLHPYHSERVLERSPLLRPLARLAGSHHERLDSSGYHRGDPAALLPSRARVLAAADAYHAMIESRPHREPLPPQFAADRLREEVRKGRLDRDAVAAVLEAAGQPIPLPRVPWPAGLTDREVDVLRLAVRGLSNRELARRLIVSEETIRTHIRHVYEKVGCSSRARLALFAMENDLLQG